MIVRVKNGKYVYNGFNILAFLTYSKCATVNKLFVYVYEYIGALFSSATLKVLYKGSSLVLLLFWMNMFCMYTRITWMLQWLNVIRSYWADSLKLFRTNQTFGHQMKDKLFFVLHIVFVIY
jgi:hypothetical protein